MAVVAADNPTELAPVGDASANAAQVNPLRQLHSLLRGRYPLAIALGLIGALIGGPLGYFIVRPEYKSTGVIEVRATLPAILYQTPENETIPNFGPFLLTQVELLRSSRVVSFAMEDPKWRAVGRGAGPEQMAAFNKSLEVVSPRNSQLIFVNFTDRDPRVAATAVEALIRAYERFFVDAEIGTGTPLVTALENLKRRQAADVKALRERIQGISPGDDPEALQQIYDTRLRLWLEATELLKQAEVAAALNPARHQVAATQPGEAATQPSPDVIQRVIETDPFLQQLERERETAARELRNLDPNLKSEHRLVVAARRRLTSIEEDLSARRQALTEMVQRAASDPSIERPVPPGGLAREPEDEIRLRQATVDARKAELDDIASRKRQVDDLNYDLKQLREVLDATNARLIQLNIETGRSGGRLQVLSYGDVPVEPEKDRRRALTAVGAIGMGGLGVAIVVLMGFFDRRIRHVDPIRMSSRSIDRMLGVLPDLPEGTNSPSAAAAAAFCVHHVRAMLQIRQRGTGRRLIAVTSPSPGDGKTTLCISLGMSLAATGSRTLLVDCDFDGGGLSARMRRLTKQQSTASDGVDTTGLHDGGIDAALRGKPPEEIILPTGYAQLSLLPLGSVPGAGAVQLAPQTLNEVFEKLAASYDTILIDTGPILGSVEASIVAAEADSVILVVSRNGDRTALDQAFDKLADAGAEVEGLVFNRALDSDVQRSAYRSSLSSRSVRRPVADDMRASTATSGLDSRNGAEDHGTNP